MSYRFPNGAVAAPDEAQLSSVFHEAMRRVYVWMFLGLSVTAASAVLTIQTPLILWIIQSRALFYGLVIAELALVVVLSARIQRLSATSALALFFAYAAVNGITLSVILLLYTLSSIGVAFFAAACLFGAMSVIGYTTQTDLTRFGGIALVAVLGLVIGSVINLFLASTALDWVITYAGILIFLGLTVYDTQRIKSLTARSMTAGDAQVVSRVGIIGALWLYLDFVNLFLRLLRVTGRRRR